MTFLKSKAFAVLAGLSTVLAVPSFALADHHGGRFDGGRFDGGRFDGGRFDGGRHFEGHRGGSHFSFSLGLGAIFSPSYYDSCDYYTPSYQTYYAPAPVVYSPAPAYYAPAPVVYSPAPAYYAPAPVVYSPPVYYTTTYYAPRYYSSSCYSYPRVSISVGGRYSYRR